MGRQIFFLFFFFFLERESERERERKKKEPKLTKQKQQQATGLSTRDYDPPRARTPAPRQAPPLRRDDWRNEHVREREPLESGRTTVETWIFAVLLACWDEMEVKNTD
jgi:hypothetical protein